MEGIDHIPLAFAFQLFPLFFFCKNGYESYIFDTCLCLISREKKKLLGFLENAHVTLDIVERGLFQLRALFKHFPGKIINNFKILFFS